MKKIISFVLSIFIFCNGCIAYANNVSKSTDYDEIKRYIIRVKNKNLSNISAFTNRVFVNIKNKVSKRELLNELVPNATIVETIQITGSILIEFETVEEAIDSIDILNKNKNVNYAEPVYNTRLLSNKTERMYCNEKNYVCNFNNMHYKCNCSNYSMGK